MKKSELSNDKISVVIATIGGDLLQKTISKLNQGSITPSEIIIIIPSDKVSRIKDLSFHNTKIIATSFSGQVKQRLEGFRRAKYDYVIQLDDDILMHHNSIEYLLDSLNKLGPGNVIGPSMYDSDSQLCMNKFDLGLLGLFKSLNAFLLSAAPWGLQRMGKITSIGLPFGIDPNLCSIGENKVDFLTGGCVISFKEDLIIEDFFPYSGKAYSEDVIHSLIRKSKGIKHYINTKAIAHTRLDNLPFKWVDFKAELKVKFYILKLIRGNKLKLLFWLISQIPTRFFRQNFKI